jgi:hypothetical protein
MALSKEGVRDSHTHWFQTAITGGTAENTSKRL